jgi:hypothetical protein
MMTQNTTQKRVFPLALPAGTIPAAGKLRTISGLSGSTNELLFLALA